MRQQLATLGQFAGYFLFLLFSLSYLKEVVIFECATNNQVTNKQKGQDICKHETNIFCATSSFRLEEDKICAPLGYYAARIGNSVSTFRDNLSVPFLRVSDSRGLKDETDRLSRTSVKNCHYSLLSTPEKRSSETYFVLYLVAKS